MPTYTYKCSSCGKCHSAMLSMDKRDTVQKCPYCGSEAKRSFEATATPHSLKGAGWARDNYGLKGGRRGK